MDDTDYAAFILPVVAALTVVVGALVARDLWTHRHWLFALGWSLLALFLLVVMVVSEGRLGFLAEVVAVVLCGFGIWRRPDLRAD